MRVKSRVLIVAAMAAAFFGTAPAFASDDSPALSVAEAPSEAPGPVSPEDPSVEEPTEAPVEPTPEEPTDAPVEPEKPSDPAEAGPVTPIEQDPNYTG